MAVFKKWFVNGSILLAVIYIFGIYMDISKEIFVSNFFYSPLLQFFLIFSLLISLVVVDSHYRKEKKERILNSEGLLYINHKNFSVDTNLLRDHFDEIISKEMSISLSTVDIKKENGTYNFSFLIFLKKDAVVALDTLTARLTAQFNFLFKDKFGDDFPSNIYIRYANEKEPFPVLDTIGPEPSYTEDDEPIVIPLNIGRQLPVYQEETPMNQEGYEEQINTTEEEEFIEEHTDENNETHSEEEKKDNKDNKQ